MTTTTQTTEKSNDLRHSILAHDGEGNPIYIKIRLNDECKNGHQDFSITCDIYQKGKPKTDRYYLMGGCCHEEILKARPDLKIFVGLHLCDYEGIPMYAVENGFYHLRNGVNNTKVEDPNFKAEFCDYYRISFTQFDTLNACPNQLQYALQLKELGILAQWKQEANKAIKLLEEMTGKTFVVDSVKTNYHAPTLEQLQEEKQKQESGYYTPQVEAQRAEDRKGAIIVKLEKERDKEISEANLEFAAKIAVLNAGGEEALNNCIYYNHTKTLAFNWRGCNMLSTEKVNAILSKMILPEGVTAKDSKGK